MIWFGMCSVVQRCVVICRRPIYASHHEFRVVGSVVYTNGKVPWCGRAMYTMIDQLTCWIGENQNSSSCLGGDRIESRFHLSMKFRFLYVALVTSNFREYTEVDIPFRQPSKDPKLGSMLTLKFPSHPTDILGGDGDGGRHGLLKGGDRGGVVSRL